MHSSAEAARIVREGGLRAVVAATAVAHLIIAAFAESDPPSVPGDDMRRAITRAVAAFSHAG